MRKQLMSHTTKDVFKFEIFANFILRDNKTGVLSSSHGFRCLDDIVISAEGKDSSQLVKTVHGVQDCRELVSGLFNGETDNHFVRIFETSSNSILGLVQIVVCCDVVVPSTKWTRTYEPYKIYAEDG